MRRHALIVTAVAFAVAATSIAGCDKARPTPANPSGPAGCLGCHGGGGDPNGAPPFDLAGSPTGGAVGAHTAHLGKQVACDECHLVPGRIADKGHIAKLDGTADGDRRAEITWNPQGRATNAGKFSASYAPVASPGRGGSCTVYCHGASLGADGGATPTPTWVGPPMNCGSCHGTSTTGAPPQHAPGLTPTDCATCHPDTVQADGSLTTTGAHINGQVEVKGCTGCHGDTARGETSPQASWAPPRDAQGATTGAKVGAHLRHVSTVASLGSRLSRPFQCSECHRMPSNGGPHGQTVVQWATGTNDLSTRGGLIPTYAGGTCASTYCHGGSLPGGSNTSPGWSATGAAACGSCHFLASPPAPHPASDRSGIAITQATQCAQCHPGTVNADGTVNVVNGMHVDGLVQTDYHPVNYSNPVTHGADALQGLGACKTCHGPTFDGVGQTPSCTQCHASAGHPTWLSECTFCHGAGTRAADAAFALVGNPPTAANKAAPPVGTQGELDATQPAVGAHLAHVQPASSLNGALTIQIQCTECHGAVLPTDEKHADGAVAIGWGSIARARGAVPAPAEGNLLPSWEATPTCTNYCHGITLAAGGSKVNPSWVAGAPEAACGTCHAARPGTWHPANADCGQCHPGYSGTGVNPATHVNGAVDPAGTSCTSCHGGQAGNAAPPYATSGAVAGVKVGAHQAHVAAGTLVAAGYACATCHAVPASTRHANDQVDMAWTLPATADGVVPAPAAGNLAVASWEAAPTCTNYCHGASLAAGGGANRVPGWTLGAGQVACGTCHAAPPPLAASPAGANHPQNAACASCHGAGYAQAGITGAAKATHVDGAVTKVVSGCTSCHGDRAAAGVTLGNNLVAAAPAAGNVATSGDTTGQSLATAPGVGAHRAHLTGTTYRTSPLGCAECHALPSGNADTTHATGAGTGGARATVAWGNLALGAGASFNNELVVPGYAGSTSGAYGATAGSCASTYCHGQFKNGAKATVAWTAAPGLTCNSCHGRTAGAAATPPGGSHLNNPACGSCHTGYTDTSVNKATHLDGQLQVDGVNCTSCHGLSSRVPVLTATDLDPSGAPLVKAAPPNDLSALASSNQVGAHLAHVNQGATGAPLSDAQRCVACHVVPTHLGLGTATITWGDIANQGGGATYTAGGFTCSSTYCHGQFTGGIPGNSISWTAAGKLGCTSCHGAPPARPHPQNLGCTTCHAGYTAASVVAATHVDGVVSKTTAGCTSCHGELPAAGVTLTNNLVAAAPGATGTNSMDTVGQLAATSAGVGAHKAHMGAGVIANVAIACTECHALPATNTDTGHGAGGGTGGARATLSWGPVATGSVNAWSGAPVVPAYAGSTSGGGGLGGGTCASTYCHGNFTNGKPSSPSWTTAGAMTCNSCHGAGTGATATLPPSPIHPQGNSSCGLCHTGYTGTTANVATHLNGRLDVAAQSCSGCHGSSTRAPVASATILDALGDNLVRAAPPTDASGLATSNQVGAHLAHVNQEATAPPYSSAQACVACHVVPTTTSHSDGVTTVTWGGLANQGATPSYDPVSQTCSSTYCHGQFPGGNGANAVAWGTGPVAKLGCTACHPVPPVAPHPSNTSCAACHPGYTAATVTVATHVNGAIEKSTAGCTACHGELTAAGVTLTTNTVAAAPGATGTNTVDVAGQSGATTSAGTGAHRAHLVNTTYRAALACTECHALPPTNADTGHAGGAGSGGARATLTWGTLARGVGAAFNNELVAPAYSGSTTGAGTNTAGGCASTYCHGQFKNGKKATVTWTATAGLTCNACHGAGTGATATLPGGTHPQGNAACGDCHTGYGGTTVVAATHMNGALDVIAMTCTSCHGDSTRTAVASAPNAALVQAAPPVDSAKLAAGNQVGAHQAHVNQGDAPGPLSSALSCENCHAGQVPVTSPHATAANPVAWGNLATAAGAAPTAYAAANRNCSNTYCHGQFPGGKAGNTVNWGTGTLAKLACNACHGQGAGVAQPGYPHPQNTGCGSCHAGYTSVAVVAATHVDGLVARSTSGCSSCHGELGAPSVTLTTNTVKSAPGASGSGSNSYDTTGATATSTSGVGAHQAHLVGSGGTPRWRSTPIACTECHALPPSNADTGHATGAGTGGARAVLTWGALAQDTAFDTKTASYAPPTCSSVYCHDPKSADTALGQVNAPSWTALPSAAQCGSCHGLPPATAAHPADTACSTCHPGYADAPGSASTIADVNALSHLNGQLDGGGDCISCHNVSQPMAAGGTRRPIVPEFAQAWSHKRSAGGVVTKFDCAVCHMEGDTATGATTAAHKDGVIDLRDPDTGTTIEGVTFGGTGAGAYTSTGTPLPFTQFSRNLGSNALEPAVQAVMINQCLSCHDADGAASPLARVPTTGTAEKPFGTTIQPIASYVGTGVTAGGVAGGVADVNASFAPTNSSYHPVTGKQNNSYTQGARMAAPWNMAKTNGTPSYGYLMSCWDCHALPADTGTIIRTVTAHGGADTLRGVPTVTGTPTTTNKVTLCTKCHAGYDTSVPDTNGHGGSSAFTTGVDSGMNVYMNYACNICHGAASNPSTTGRLEVARPIRAQDVHGVNALPTNGAAKTGRWSGASQGSPLQVETRPYAFIRNTQMLTNHTPKKIGGTTYSAAETMCLMNVSPCGSNRNKPYTVGGTY